MIRALGEDGQVLIGITRSGLELLLAGEHLLSPGFDGRGPQISIVFGETDEAILAKLRDDGAVTPATSHHDRRSS